MLMDSFGQRKGARGYKQFGLMRGKEPLKNNEIGMGIKKVN